jgi:hypothetical protein
MPDQGGFTGIGVRMPQYFFRIRNGRYSGMSNNGIEAPDACAAWTEMTRVCSELVGSIARRLKSNSEWQMEMLDEAQRPLFRIRLVAETITDGVAGSQEGLALHAAGPTIPDDDDQTVPAFK